MNTLKHLIILSVLTFPAFCEDANVDNSKPLLSNINKDILLNERNAAIRDCITIIKDLEQQKTNHQQYNDAIFLLGEFRAIEAIPMLIEIIDYDCNPRPAVTFYHSSSYGAAHALIKIGYSTAPALIEILRKTDGSDKSPDWFNRHLCMSVLIAIMGKKQATMLLSNEIEKLKGVDKERIQSAINDMKTIGLAKDCLALSIKYHGSSEKDNPEN